MSHPHDRSRRFPALLLAIGLAAASPASLFGVDVEGLDLEAVASGLDAPVAITHAGDGRLFVTLQGGQVVIFNTLNGELLPRPFLDIRDRVGFGGERGLLSVAFHPDYAANGFFFVDYTDLSGNTVIARYSVSADRNAAEASSEAVLLRIDQPFSNHNGGLLQFGPDGFLYAATGDGGSANDPLCSGQDASSLLGKILRLDVDQNAGAPPFYGIPASNPFVGDATARDEIWALGLRNPWRFSFDRATGDLYIADVGQSAREEVDLQSAANAGGENYGWKMMEGTSCTGNSSGCGFAIPGCNAPEYTPPIFDYGHESGRCSITGGYVYRGSAVPQAAGAYFYGDYCSGEIWAAEPAGGAWRSDRLAPRVPSLTSFGEDASGELYAVGGGTLYRLAGPSDGGPPGDCALAAGDPLYCTECGPCAEGQGGCRGDDQCAAGLACAENFGARFGLPRTADVCLTPGSLAPPQYDFSSLSVDGSGNRAVAAAINNAGLVVGWADNGGAGGGFESRGFVLGFLSLELLDAANGQNTRALALNERGDVYGVLLNADGSEQTGFFLYRDGGFDLLDRGANNQIRRGFVLTGMNESGDLAGSVARRADGRLLPYLYTAERGWTNLATLDPRFASSSTRVELINDSGDLVLTRYLPDPEAASRAETFLLHGDQLFALGDFGGRIDLPAAINGAGRVVGTAYADDGFAPHPYVYSGPGGRLIDIRPKMLAAGDAVYVTAKGIVGGTLASADVTDTLFIWDNRRERKMRLQARGVDFGRLLAGDLVFDRVDDVRMNERLELVGRLYALRNEALVLSWFYFSPATGLLDVQDLLAAAGGDGTVVEVVDFNDWGALLLDVRDADGASTVVVLTPRESTFVPLSAGSR